MSVSIDSPHVQEISAALHRAATASGHTTLWLAIDGSDQPMPEIAGICWSARTWVNVSLSHPEIDPRWHPRWLGLKLETAQDAHILNHSIAWALEERQPHRLRAGTGRRVSGWLLAQEELIQSAAQHCSRLMLRRAPKTAGQFLLRLHDPAVMWAVWQILLPEQKSAWWGPIGGWHLLDPLGELTLLEAPTSGPIRDALTPSPPLSSRQWQDIQNITPLHQVLQTLLASKPASSRQYQQWLLSGLQALRRANAHQFDELHSLRLFAELALTRHPGFDQHPRVQHLLKQREPGEPLGGLLCELTEQDWQELINDLNQPTRQS